MTIFTVAVKYLRARTVASFLTALSVTLAVSLVIASVLLTRGIKEGFVEGTTDYNLVVGAKGSPTQLVLSVVFRMDVATPNILTRTFRRLQEDPRVDGAGVFRGVPVAAKDVLPLGRAVLSRRRSGSAHLRGAAGLRGGTAHGLADRRPLLRGRRNGRVPSDGGRNPSTDPERRRPRHFLLARELLGDERDRAEDADQAPDRRARQGQAHVGSAEPPSRTERLDRDPVGLTERGAAHDLQSAWRGGGSARRDPGGRGHRRRALRVRLDVRRHPHTSARDRDHARAGCAPWNDPAHRPRGVRDARDRRRRRRPRRRARRGLGRLVCARRAGCSGRESAGLQRAR